MTGLSQAEMIKFVEHWVAENKSTIAQDLSNELSPFITSENVHSLELILTLANRLLMNWTPLLMIELLEANNKALNGQTD